MRIIQLVLFFCATLLPLVQPAQAQFTWTTNADNTLTITGYTGSGGAVSIPTNINGLTVTVIGEGAFYDCTSVTAVTFPGSVTNIGENAFAFCFSMASVTIPESVTVIGDGAFQYCASLTSAALPGGVTSIGGSLFEGCFSMASVTIPSGVTSIGNSAFASTGLTNVTIPSGVTNLGDSAFLDCANLGSVTIPASITNLLNDAFDGCTSLASLYFYGNAPAFGINVFEYDTNATAYYLRGAAGWGSTFDGLPAVLLNPGDIWYVWQGSPANGPGSTWGTAFQDIQSAIDAATAGDTVLVTDGVYATGARIVYGAVSNRVALCKPLNLQSVNGPGATIIQGGTATRCVYLTNGATLSGFTLTGGITLDSGPLTDVSGGGLYCESATALVSNCVMTSNTADIGGGVSGGTLNNCMLNNNSAGSSGGADSGTLNDCVLTANAANDGGGAGNCALNNCALIANAALLNGGGAEICALNNCTLAGNSACGAGGGVDGSTLNNCIAYHNAAPGDPNFTNSTLNYCCTTPLPGDGTNNITAEPQMADNFHLSADSPCIGAGSSNFSMGTDLDGLPWLNPPSIGCNEYYPDAAGNLTVSISSDYLAATPGFTLTFTADLMGDASSNLWDFGDGGTTSNQLFFVQHDWAGPGDYPVVFTAFNDDNPGGISATTIVHVAAQLIYYVDVNSTNPVVPYLSWDTAAAGIQDAVDAALPVSNSLVLVTNGLYQTGGRPVNGYSLTNRVTVAKPITVQSACGPLLTIIQGGQDPGDTNGNCAVRCVYLGSNAVLAGFTLTNGATMNDQFESFGFHLYMGGGVCGEVGASVSNCIITGCSASDMGGGFYGDGGYDGVSTNVLVSDCVMAGCNASSGGGAEGGILNDCTLSNNLATMGGGATYCVLSNCTLSANAALSGGNGSGGGVDSCALTNCVLSCNSADNSGGGAYQSTLNNCILSTNTAVYGGGGEQCTLGNCILTANSAIASQFAGGGGADSSVLNNCVLTSNWVGSSSSPGSVQRPKQPGPVPLMITSHEGGGADSSTLTNCTLMGNQADGGGGAASSTLNNCLVTDNSASYGGGVENSTLNNCTLTGNSASDPDNYGGAQQSTLNNCIAYYNTNGDYGWFSSLNYCCTAQLPDGGIGNITNEPGFVNCAVGDFHLQTNSPCINSGNNAYVTTATDFDGNPRIVGGTVDIGAYEYQTPTSIISYAWLQQYGLPTDGSADFAYTDGDLMNNYQEWIAGTDPTNPLSALTMISATPTNNPPGVVVTWQSVDTRTYYLQVSTNLSVQPIFSTIQTNIPGQSNTTSYTDTNATGPGPYFYRVGVVY